MGHASFFPSRCDGDGLFRLSLDQCIGTLLMDSIGVVNHGQNNAKNTLIGKQLCRHFTRPLLALFLSLSCLAIKYTRPRTNIDTVMTK